MHLHVMLPERKEAKKLNHTENFKPFYLKPITKNCELLTSKQDHVMF